MIEYRNVSKSFKKFRALDNIQLSLEKGECVSLIGPNGSGKTTLIKCLLGMVIPDKGELLFDGKSIAGEWNYRSRIGYMPQISRYPQNLSISGVLTMMKDIRKNSSQELDEELIHLLNLEAISDKKLGTLSGGTRQKVSACLAFLFSPPVLVLDEPTAGLDPLSSEILKNKIRSERAKGKLILITSHILSDLDEITSQVVYMQEGKLKFHKALQQLKQETGQQSLGKAIAHIIGKENITQND